MTPIAGDPRFSMVAGEASGDLLASLLLGGMRQRWPRLSATGIGGPKMAAQGFTPWWPSDKLAVHGYAEALRHYREISGIRDALGQRLLRERPQLFIGVDAPDFNLGLEARLKAAGMRTVHFVCPSIWAWRGGRAKRLSRSADHVLCLFPFEPELLKGHGIQASYVGHPLADAIPLAVPRAAARQALGLDGDAPVLAVMPGSRRGEINNLLPAFLGAVRLLHAARPELRFVLPVAPGLRPLVDGHLTAHGAGLPLALLDGRSHEALAACDATLIASGTATLEAALFKRPMVIAYRLHPLSWQIMKRMRYQPWIGLPNILCRDFVVPELLQHEATPRALADAVLQWLDAPQRAQALEQRFMELHHLLRRDTARTATNVIARLLDGA
jgi:lipid-A-disaccharide synthase